MNRPAFALPLVFSLLLSAAPSRADDASQAAAGQLPEKISFLVTFGEEKCPESSDAEEIVVCATAPEGDRYRIPKDLRKDEDAESTPGGSWPEAVASLDGEARAILPNSCSVNGSNGFTGCTQALLRQWFAEQRSRK